MGSIPPCVTSERTHDAFFGYLRGGDRVLKMGTSPSGNSGGTPTVKPVQGQLSHLHLSDTGGQLYYIPPQVPQQVYSPRATPGESGAPHGGQPNATNSFDPSVGSEERNGLDCISFGVGFGIASSLGPLTYLFLCCWDQLMSRSFPSKRNKTWFTWGVTAMVFAQVFMGIALLCFTLVLASLGVNLDESAGSNT